MSSTLSWQLPGPEPHLAARRYLLGRRDCLAPIRTAVFQHPDLAPMIRALFAFATDGILLAEERRPARPLVHLAFDEAWQLYLPEREYDDAHGPMWPRPIVPLETYLAILPVAYIAREMAGLRLRCGDACCMPSRRPSRHNYGWSGGSITMPCPSACVICSTAGCPRCCASATMPTRLRPDDEPKQHSGIRGVMDNNDINVVLPCQLFVGLQNGIASTTMEKDRTE